MLTLKIAGKNDENLTMQSWGKTHPVEKEKQPPQDGGIGFFFALPWIQQYSKPFTIAWFQPAGCIHWKATFG